MRRPRAVLCDDEEMVLEALTVAAEMLGIDVVASTPDPELALELVREHRPDLCVLDAHFPDASGPEVAVRMKAAVPGMTTIMLTADASSAVWEAFETKSLGGVISKTLDMAAFRDALQATSRGERVVAGWHRVPRQRSAPEHETLTLRERDVLAALVRGATTSDIAAELGISAHTVRSHIQNVLRKLNVSTRAKATQVAIAHRLLEAS